MALWKIRCGFQGEGCRYDYKKDKQNTDWEKRNTELNLWGKNNHNENVMGEWVLTSWVWLWLCVVKGRKVCWVPSAMSLPFWFLPCIIGWNAKHLHFLRKKGGAIDLLLQCLAEHQQITEERFCKCLLAVLRITHSDASGNFLGFLPFLIYWM